MIPDLKGKAVLITGASTGIGAAAARAFAARRLQGRRPLQRQPRRRREAVAAGIRAAGGEALPLGGDVMVEADVRRIVRETVAAFGAHRRAGQQRRRDARAGEDRGLHAGAHQPRAGAQLHAGRAVHARGGPAHAQAEIGQRDQRHVDRGAPRRRRRGDPLRRGQGVRVHRHPRLGEGGGRRRHPRQRAVARRHHDAVPRPLLDAPTS